MSNLKLFNVLEENTTLSLDEQGGARGLAMGVTGDAKVFRNAKSGVAAAFDDVLKFAKGDKNQIVGLTKKSPNKAVVITNLDDLLHALRVEGGMAADVLAKFNQGLLKSSKTPIDLIDNITKEVVGSKNFVSKYGKLTNGEMRKALKTAGYGDNAVESFMKNAKKNPNFKKAYTKGVEKRKLKKTQGGKDVNMDPKGTGSNVPQTQKKTLIEKSKELLNMIKVKKMSWKQLLMWGAGIGIGATALWWWLYDNNVPIPDDTPQTEPQDTGEWGPCLSKMISEKSARVSVTPKGTVVVVVSKTDKYPGGIQFFSNGRVMNLQTKEMGTWKCSSTGVVKETNINEQVDTQLATDVNDLIDYLDFPVYGNDLQNAYNILLRYSKNGKGKQLLRNYSRTDNEDLKSVVMSLNMKMRDDESGQLVDAIVKLYDNIMGNTTVDSSQQQNKSTVTINEQNSKIYIVWDKDKKTNDGGTPKVDDGNKKDSGKSKLKFHKCDSFPFEFGCRSPLIGEIQKCIGVSPSYGNFGPWTLKALENLKIDTSNGITRLIYDTIMNSCGEIDPSLTQTKTPESSQTPQTPMTLSSLVDEPKKSETTPSVTPRDANKFYTDLANSGYIAKVEGDDDKNHIKYKGPDLNNEDLTLLDTAMSEKWYDRIKQVDKKYDSKYVYLKRD